jgi:hypothetical protein
MTLLLNKPADTARYLTLADDTTEGCGLLGGRIVSRSGSRRDLDAECARSFGRWASRAAAGHADIAVLMIGAWDVFDDQVGGDSLGFGTPGWDQYFDSRLDQVVASLKNAGVPRIELALLPCYRPVKIPGSAPGSWPERGDDQRIRHVNTLLSAYAGNAGNAANPVEALYPPPAFCDDPVISASRAYRWDGVHFYKPGAKLYLRTAIPQLLAPLR